MMHNLLKISSPIPINVMKLLKMSHLIVKYSLPFTSSKTICQNFNPPKFSHVQYCMSVCLSECIYV